jgi:hypothetical protein
VIVAQEALLLVRWQTSRATSGVNFVSALKTSERLRIASDIFRQEFEGDKTVESDIFCLVDHTHAAATEFRDDAIMRDGLADHSRESYLGDSGESIKSHRVDRSQGIVGALLQQ